MYMYYVYSMTCMIQVCMPIHTCIKSLLPLCSPRYMCVEAMKQKHGCIAVFFRQSSFPLSADPPFEQVRCCSIFCRRSCPCTTTTCPYTFAGFPSCGIFTPTLTIPVKQQVETTG